MDVYREYYPELLEELEGMADGAGFDPEQLVFRFICGEILFYTEMLKLNRGCTIFGIRNGNGIFVGRNYDWGPAEAPLAASHTVLNSEKNSFIAFTVLGIGSNSVEDAVNNKGLYIGITFADSHRCSFGLSSLHIGKLVAETCSTVDEALALFEKVPLCCPKNYFVADRHGDMAVVEHTSERHKVLYPKDDILIQTNHYAHPELAEEDMILHDMPFSDTYLRYYEVLRNLNLKKEIFNYPGIMKLLTNPDSYIFENQPAIQTLWSLALDMKNARYRVYWNMVNRRRTRLLEI